MCAYLVGAYESVTPGIFHKLTGALTGKGLQILSAEIHTLADDLVLDRFYVEDSDFAGEPPPERTREVCDALVAALTVNADKVPVFRRLWGAQRGSAAAHFAELPTRIRFDDSTSDRFTIITIFTYDRRGLLYSITRTLFECGLVVHVAKIATHLDQVVDAFYVTNAKGQKIHSPQQLSEIRQRLTAALALATTAVRRLMPPLTRRQRVSTIAYLAATRNPQAQDEQMRDRTKANQSVSAR